MPDNHIEKSFLYLILLSLLLHAAVFGVISAMPPEPQRVEKVTMVDLHDLPAPPPPVKPEPKPEPKPEAQPTVQAKPRPVPRPVNEVRLPKLPPELAFPHKRKEAAPQGRDSTERVSPADQDAGKTERKQLPEAVGKADSVFRTPEKGGKETVRGTGAKIELAKLFPSAKTMNSLEESYRQKYRGAEQGDTRMMDTQDPLVEVFSSKLLAAANNSLAIESRKRTLRGKGAVGVLMVTCNRDGSIESVKMIESTRNAELDLLFIDAVNKAGYIGPLPKKWPHEKLKLIWFAVSRGGEPAP